MPRTYETTLALTLLLSAAPCCGAQPQPAPQPPGLPYCVVDTGQKCIFSDVGQLLQTPKPGGPFCGQDAQYQGPVPSYLPSVDGLTVYDKNTGLTWQRSPEVNADGVLNHNDKLTWDQARARPAALNAAKFGGYDDWRLPTIKELYSLIDFRGVDPSGPPGADTPNLRPFIDTRYFEFVYGQASFGERVIDSQYASSTVYVDKTWRGFEKIFGVNFADGRIKGYDRTMPGGGEKAFYVLCVRGNKNYGLNKFKDNGDRTITDEATGLMWSQEDNGKGLNWQQALAWAQAKNRENYLGHNDWRLPNAKELQSIVDYTRSPDTTQSAASDPVFTDTRITNEAGQEDYPCYWTGTTHGESLGRAAIYVSFGRSLGFMGGAWRDVHGAGSQRSDPKAGDPANFPQGRGPQGDAIRIYNFVRLVRNVDPQSVRLVEPDLTPLPTRQPPGSAGPGPAIGRPSGRPGAVDRFQLIPPFVGEKLNLTPDQQRQITQLEKEVRAKLERILTPPSKPRRP
jgi:hypothetical protein